MSVFIAVAILVLIVLGILLFMKCFFPILLICGDSMHPTYNDGEALFGIRVFNKRKLKVGDVVVYKIEGKKVIKRLVDIKEMDGDLFFYFVGDNKKNSYDSRYYGFVPASYVSHKLIDQRRCQE